MSAPSSTRTAPVTARRGRLALARMCLLAGTACSLLAAASPTMHLLFDATASGLDFRASVSWSLVSVGFFIAGAALITNEFRRIDWVWPLEDLR